MTALAKLPEKWRAAAQALRDNPSYYVEIRSRGVAAAYDNCADELTAALSPAELGGVEAVAWLVESELAGKVSAELYEAAADNAIADVVKEYGTAYGATTKRPLYTTPRAAEAISLVDIGLCNWAAHILSDPERFNTRANDASAAIRRLVAALTPPSAKGE